MITGEDLVEWQLAVAAGHPLPKKQDQLGINGHAFEARIYAENPNSGFLPGTGRLVHLSPPKEDDSRRKVRVETGVRQGDNISIYYDPMIAKLVVHDKDRDSALRRLRNCLLDYQICGLTTNINFLLNVAKHDAFRRGDVDTGFIPRYQSDLIQATSCPSQRSVLLAVLHDLIEMKTAEADARDFSYDSTSPWFSTNGFRPNYLAAWSQAYTFTAIPAGGSAVSGQQAPKAPAVMRIAVSAVKANEEGIDDDDDGDEESGRWNLTIKYDDEKDKSKDKIVKLTVQGERDIETGEIILDIENEVRIKGNVVEHDSNLHVFTDHGSEILSREVPSYKKLLSVTNTGSLISPMPGKIVKVVAKVGDVVKAGDPIVILSAMKMEHTVRSPSDGKVTKIHFKEGDMVEDKKMIAIVQEDSN